MTAGGPGCGRLGRHKRMRQIRPDFCLADGRRHNCPGYKRLDALCKPRRAEQRVGDARQWQRLLRRLIDGQPEPDPLLEPGYIHFPNVKKRRQSLRLGIKIEPDQSSLSQQCFLSASDLPARGQKRKQRSKRFVSRERPSARTAMKWCKWTHWSCPGLVRSLPGSLRGR